MIESVTSKAVRCDNCSQLLKPEDKFIHVFTKDFCYECSAKILECLEEEQVITQEDFKEFFNENPKMRGNL